MRERAVGHVEQPTTYYSWVDNDVSEVFLIDVPVECSRNMNCQQLLDALEGMDAQALAPMIAAAAEANAKLMGDKEWRVIADKADAAVKNPHGKRHSDDLDNVQVMQKAPTGNSAAAGLRKLRRYAESDSLCEQYGVVQDTVTEQYGKTLRGEKSVHRALIDCGLKKKITTAAGLGIDGPPEDVARRIIKRLGAAGAAALANALSTQLTK